MNYKSQYTSLRISVYNAKQKVELNPTPENKAALAKAYVDMIAARSNMYDAQV